MAVRSFAAPPTPWSKGLAEPQIHETAYIHEFSNIIGDVRIGANVMVSPGTSIRADEGYPFYIGEGTNIQDGVVIHGLDKGQVVGDDQNHYSVWIGKNSSITHVALIHGPAYVGDNCFIGFRSTVFNARVGHGCIVMMHALIQDVEIPPGKYVPSGAVITNQQQADRLPDVQQGDMKFTSHVVGVNNDLRAGYICAGDDACLTQIRDEPTQHYISNGSKGSATYMNSNLSPEIVEQVQNLLDRGYKIGTEHVDARRFRTGSWQSCSPIAATNVSDAIAALTACLEEHRGEYVRLFGIDPKAKQRVLETVIQRPDDLSQSSKTAVSSASNPKTQYRNTTVSAASSSQLSSEVVDQVRQMLAQGYKIGTEHVDARRFRTGSWSSCSPIESKNESEVVAALKECCVNHEGEFVRMFGIDPKGKRRVLETMIQRPDGQSQPNQATRPESAPSGNVSNGSRSQATASTGLKSEVVDQLRHLLAQGNRISAEHVDERRFRTGSWASCGQIQATNESEAIAALEATLAEYEGEYVRLVGIDPKGKRRVLETIIQRPKESAVNR